MNQSRSTSKANGLAALVRAVLLLAFVLQGPRLVSAAAPTTEVEPGWLSVVFATGQLREKIDAMPIERRPYRPLHFYGNTVRRLHYRGTPFPRLDEIVSLPSRILPAGRRDTPTAR